MGGFVEFLGANAVLSQRELDAGDFQAGFFQDFPLQRLFGRFARLDLPAGNSPKAGPFEGVQHEQFLVGTDNQAADGGDRGQGFRNGVALQNFGDREHVRCDVIG